MLLNTFKSYFAYGVLIMAISASVVVWAAGSTGPASQISVSSGNK